MDRVSSREVLLSLLVDAFGDRLHAKRTLLFVTVRAVNGRHGNCRRLRPASYIESDKSYLGV